jgi:hypothetical protein
MTAESAIDRVEQLIALTERLTELVAREAAAFEQRRPQDAAVLVEETAKLANIYRHESAKVRANPQVIAQASLARRQGLVRATEAFDAVLARQGRALEAAKTITEGLVRAIADEVASQRQQSAGYGPGATTYAPSASVAITLNQRA